MTTQRVGDSTDGSGSGSGSQGQGGNRSRRGRGRRRSSGARNGNRPSKSESRQSVKREYLPSEEDLLEEEALADGYDDTERIYVRDLKTKSMQELAQVAEEMEVENASGMRKQDLLFAILQAQTAKQGKIFAEGVLEILQAGLRAYPAVTLSPRITISPISPCAKIVPGSSMMATSGPAAGPTEPGLRTFGGSGLLAIWWAASVMP